MILRNEDVLKNTPGKYEGKEVDRFKFINKMVNETNSKLVHRPTILCTEIMDYPEAIEYIKEQGPLGTMEVELHGWKHIDYVHKGKGEIEDMLKQCQDWFDTHLGFQFTMWATPWGGDTPTAREVCQEMGIALESTQSMMHGTGSIVDHFRSGGKYSTVATCNILFHWWSRGVNVFRLCDILKYGSYEAAAKADERGWF